MQQINSVTPNGRRITSATPVIGQNLDATMAAESSWVELQASFQEQYEKFLQDTSDEIAERTRRLNELKSYKNSIHHARE